MVYHVKILILISAFHIYNIVKIHQMDDDYICINLFPFPLMARLRSDFHCSFQCQCHITWDEQVEKQKVIM